MIKFNALHGCNENYDCFYHDFVKIYKIDNHML